MDESSAHRSAGPPDPTVWPSVGFTDVGAGINFLTRTLGFTVTAQYQGVDRTLEHAEARWPDGGGIMFGSRGKPGAWGDLGPQGVYVVAAESTTVDRAWAQVQEDGWLEVLEPLTDTAYGSHQFTVRDGDGNLWTMGTYRGA